MVQRIGGHMDKVDERTISSIDHQYDMARLERIIRRLWIIIILQALMLGATIGYLVYDRSQWDYSTITVDSDDGGNANYLQAGANGVINNVESDSQNEDTQE